MKTDLWLKINPPCQDAYGGIIHIIHIITAIVITTIRIMMCRTAANARYFVWIYVAATPTVQLILVTVSVAEGIDILSLNKH